MIYGTRANGNLHGLVLTKPIVVETMLDRVGYTQYHDLRNIRVIEPSAGDGAFAVEIIERLYHSSLKFDFSFQKALSNLIFFELDNEMGILLEERIGSTLNKYNASVPENLIRIEDFLLSKSDKCDLIIGNPPYVRHENIPDEKKELYRRKFPTFKHRSDLYIGFYDKGLRLLNENGSLSFICSNRWLKNQYGVSLRNLIQLNYCLEEIIDLEETCPFEEEVIAYPAITTIRNTKKNTKANYYLIDDITKLRFINKDTDVTRTLDIVNSKNWFSYVWSGEEHEKFLTTIESQGFQIGIGVATGLDKVFIRNDFKSLIEEEILLPILTSKDLKNNKLNWSGNYILNPFEITGQLIDLTKYPKAKEYLESHRSLLERRHVAKKNPRHWYKTIDRIKPTLTNQDKIILPDISGNSHIFIDKGNFYPHHNLYYITGSNQKKLVILASILSSDFIRKQLLELGTTMKGGYPRWQSQNLKKLRIPMIDAMPKETSDALIQAYHIKDYRTINQLVTEDEIGNYSFQVGQTTLFEPKGVEYGKNKKHDTPTLY
ncbi:MAG: Eco57I restriction-modification methylase domain-containing protein [Cryomorphaceae bacterium]|nr:Eco57I restriction-modification methylase domain-containing protein [Cryomorphaceae bacterium]